MRIVVAGSGQLPLANPGVSIVNQVEVADIVFGVSAFAPAAFVGVTLVLLVAALVAFLVPATRAASVDSMVALRQD